jgi:hypothetical protein
LSVVRLRYESKIEWASELDLRICMVVQEKTLHVGWGGLRSGRVFAGPINLFDGWDDFEGGTSAVVTDTGKIEST